MTRCGRKRGSSLIEFALVALLFCFLLLAFIELGRMFLVYNSVANAAKAGVRYAIVHGDRGTGICGAVTGLPADIEGVVKAFASSAPLDVNQLTITVSYTPGNCRGSLVDVAVVYPYDPLVGYFPLQVNLGSTSEGVMAF